MRFTFNGPASGPVQPHLKDSPMARIVALTLLIALGASIREGAMAEAAPCAPTACAIQLY